MGITIYKKKMKQTMMNLNKGRHGGRRSNSGRKRIHSKGVAHTKREKISPHTPLHINFKYQAFIRTPGMLKNLEQAIQNASEFDFNVSHFTIQHNHIHIIAETKNNKSLDSETISERLNSNRTLSSACLENTKRGAECARIRES